MYVEYVYLVVVVFPPLFGWPACQGFANFPSASQIEFVEYILQVCLYRPIFNPQIGSDLIILVSHADESDHFPLTSGEGEPVCSYGLIRGINI